MTTAQLTDFHAWLYNALPLSSSDLMAELQLCHKALPDAYRDMPKDALQLTSAIRQLEKAGLIEKRGSLWHWLQEPSRKEPQACLF